MYIHASDSVLSLIVHCTQYPTHSIELFEHFIIQIAFRGLFPSKRKKIYIKDGEGWFLVLV